MHFKFFFILRRANGIDYYSNYSIVEKIKGIISGKKDKFIVQTKNEDLNTTKTEIIDETIKNDNDTALKNENFYVKSPILVNGDGIYETICDYNQAPDLSSLNYAQVMHLEQSTINESQNNDQVIYSTPTNKVLSKDEKRIFLETSDLN